MVTRLETEVRYIKGIGPKKAEILERLGVATLKDLLLLFPRRHEDRKQFKKISQIAVGDFVTILATVYRVRLQRIRHLTLFEVTFADGSGRLQAVWFNQPFLKDVFKEGDQFVLSGKVEFYRGLQLKSPEYEKVEEETEATIHTGRIVPIYPLTEGLFQKSLRRLLFQVLQQVSIPAVEYLPAEIVTRYRFGNISETLHQIHFPDSFETLEQSRRRIVYEEFLKIQIEVLSQLNLQEKKKNVFPISLSPEVMRAFQKNLPFSLTPDQEKVLRDIFDDMKSPVPMNRLIQGDVGSGKTLVACIAILAAVKSGYQAVFLIPTEVLAEQHAQTLLQFLSPFQIAPEFLTGGTPKKQRTALLEKLNKGEISVLIGTHALLQEDVQFRNLGLIVIDEQHKFGVMQRARWLQEAARPHLLVMTATPIPRTLGLTLYGDLHISTIKTMPRGRKPIATYFIAANKEKDMVQFLKKRMAAGEQVYYIFPLVEETEKADMKAAVEEYEKLSQSVYQENTAGLVHGKMPREEKEAVMREFKAGKIQILFATSVVEVGIDNPNATSIIIEHAERFGLSQLHQLRGRVGRGEKQSYCFLLGKLKTELARQRVAVLCRTQDGFTLSEEDLRMRGPGDFLGTRQSGLPELLLADLLKDQDILEAARTDAERLIETKKGKEIISLIFFAKRKTVSAVINN